MQLAHHLSSRCRQEPRAVTRVLKSCSLKSMCRLHQWNVFSPQTVSQQLGPRGIFDNLLWAWKGFSCTILVPKLFRPSPSSVAS